MARQLARQRLSGSWRNGGCGESLTMRVPCVCQGASQLLCKRHRSVVAKECAPIMSSARLAEAGTVVRLFPPAKAAGGQGRGVVITQHHALRRRELLRRRKIMHGPNAAQPSCKTRSPSRADQPARWAAPRGQASSVLQCCTPHRRHSLQIATAPATPHVNTCHRLSVLRRSRPHGGVNQAPLCLGEASTS